MTYKIQQIEGIGPHFGDRLAIAGILTSDDLLLKCATADLRTGVATHTGLSELQLETWKNQADLMRVSGIGSEYGQLLEASGIQSVRELSLRSPENVVHLLDRVNTEKQLTRAIPPLITVRKWIDQAKTMTATAARAAVDRSSRPDVQASLATTMLHSVTPVTLPRSAHEALAK